MLLIWSRLTQSLAQTSFTPESDYLHSPDLFLFTWALIYLEFLGVLHVLLYSFIHEEEIKTKLNVPLS